MIFETSKLTFDPSENKTPLYHTRERGRDGDDETLTSCVDDDDDLYTIQAEEQGMMILKTRDGIVFY
jgi:hypothetical protein